MFERLDKCLNLPTCSTVRNTKTVFLSIVGITNTDGNVTAHPSDRLFKPSLDRAGTRTAGFKYGEPIIHRIFPKYRGSCPSFSSWGRNWVEFGKIEFRKLHGTRGFFCFFFTNFSIFLSENGSNQSTQKKFWPFVFLATASWFTRTKGKGDFKQGELLSWVKLADFLA